MTRTPDHDPSPPTLAELLCSAHPVKEVALLAGINPKTLYRLINAGIVPAYRRPRFLRCRLEDVLAPYHPPSPPTNRKSAVEGHPRARASSAEAQTPRRGKVE